MIIGDDASLRPDSGDFSLLALFKMTSTSNSPVILTKQGSKGSRFDYQIAYGSGRIFAQSVQGGSDSSQARYQTADTTNIMVWD